MDNRIRLIFKNISEIVGGNGMAVAVLTDEDEKHAISVVCDAEMKYQIGLRSTGQGKGNMLPEVMVALMKEVADLSRYEIFIHNILDGEYKTVVMNNDTLEMHPIRLSDGILLSQVSGIPIYIDRQLMYRQRSAYNGVSDRMAIPINTLDTARLSEELTKAVEAENYRLASQIKEELDKREKEK